MEKRSKTDTSWVLYFKIVSLMLDFIAAEKSGDCNLHLKTIELMIPFFHSAGHFSNAKSAHIYLQDMLNLKNVMSQQEYKKFTENDYWTVRRKNQFWAGIFSDQTIERTLMKLLSIEGGPFCRGATESVFHTWLKGTLNTKDIIECMQGYTNTFFEKSFQHKDSKDSRLKIEALAIEKLKEFLNFHNPFSTSSSGLICISTALVADEKINCHNAFETGLKTMAQIDEENFKDLKLKRSNVVLTLNQSNKTIVIDNEVIEVSSELIFQRICAMCMSAEILPELINLFQYKLAPYPLSLFNKFGMRKNNKSDFYAFFDPIDMQLDRDNYYYVIDGGMMVQKLWTPNTQFSAILKQYVSHIKFHYGENMTVGFDGYDELTSKSAERNRRQKSIMSAEYQFDEE